MWSENFAPLIGSVGPTVAVMSFIRTSWEQRSVAGRSKNLGTSLAVLKAWGDLREQPRCTFSSDYLDQQSALAEKRVENDVRALYESSAKKCTSLRVWFAVGAAVLAVMSLLLTAFKLDDVVSGNGWVEPAWWVANGGALLLGGLGLLVGRSRKDKKHESGSGSGDSTPSVRDAEGSTRVEPATSEPA